MTRGERFVIVTVLNQAPFVRWDRFTEDPNGTVSVYGWIDRDDGRSDFVLIQFDPDGSYGWTTSSADRSDELGRLLYGEGHEASGHLVCQRVEIEMPDVACAVRL